MLRISILFIIQCVCSILYGQLQWYQVSASGCLLENNYIKLEYSVGELIVGNSNQMSPFVFSYGFNQGDFVDSLDVNILRHKLELTPSLYFCSSKRLIQVCNLSEPGYLKLCNINGAIVFSKSVLNNEIITAISLKKGVFLASLSTSNKVFIKKIIVY